ncbi:MAG: mechanosensitive ion channel [Legionellales bacterium]|nr:mechanosensitive ion channel [Legionellales bacterium]
MLIPITDVLHHLGLQSQWAAVLSIVIVALGIAALSWLSNYIAKRYLVILLKHLSESSGIDHLRLLSTHQVFNRAANFVPIVVIYYLAPMMIVDSLFFSQQLAAIVQMAAKVFMILIVYWLVCALLNYANSIYNTLTFAHERPIKSYLQVAKLILFLFAAILIISTVMQQSALGLLTGLGAMTAIISLIFKDSILGFVASVQLASYDMVRLGDWIEVPKYGADGDVVDISLNTVKVQNWDKTIVTIPSYALLIEGVKNWRGMQDSGGRRIKRCFYIDMHTVRFCTDNDLQQLQNIELLTDYIQHKRQEITEYNAKRRVDQNEINGKRLTNVGLLRHYLVTYLHQHPEIRQDYTLLVRQLNLTEHGLPIEIYVFTKTTNWNEYERIQCDIFDHILAIMPYFDLCVFQDITDQHNLVHLEKSQQPAITLKRAHGQ